MLCVTDVYLSDIITHFILVLHLKMSLRICFSYCTCLLQS